MRRYVVEVLYAQDMYGDTDHVVIGVECDGSTTAHYIACDAISDRHGGCDFVDVQDVYEDISGMIISGTGEVFRYSGKEYRIWYDM